MTLTLSTQGIAGASGFPHDVELIGSTDQTVIYSGDTAMKVALPKVRDGSSDTVDDGWSVSVLVTGGGALELVDQSGHRVLLVPGYGQAALVSNDDTHFDGTYGGWTEAHEWPNVQVEETTAYTHATYGSLASDATPSVLRVEQLDVQSTVSITYFDEGVLGQRVTLTFSGGTNSTKLFIINAASFSLEHGLNWTMTTGEALEMQMVSTDGWKEIGRRAADVFFYGDMTGSSILGTPTCEASLIDVSRGNIVKVSCLASAVSSLTSGEVGQIVSIFSSAAGPNVTHSTLALDLNTVTNHGTAYGMTAGVTMQFQCHSASGLWLLINDGNLPAS